MVSFSIHPSDLTSISPYGQGNISQVIFQTLFGIGKLTIQSRFTLYIIDVSIRYIAQPINIQHSDVKDIINVPPQQMHHLNYVL